MPNPTWYKSRLTPADYQTVFDMKARGIQQVRIAAYVGCTQAHVSFILRGKIAGARNGPKSIHAPEAP